MLTLARLLLGAAWHDADLVCDRGDGKHLDPDGFSHAFERLVERASSCGREQWTGFTRSFGHTYKQRSLAGSS